MRSRLYSLLNSKRPAHLVGDTGHLTMLKLGLTQPTGCQPATDRQTSSFVTRHSATTFTVKVAVISGWSATLAGNSPVVLMVSTSMDLASTATLEASA